MTGRRRACRGGVRRRRRRACRGGVRRRRRRACRGGVSRRRRHLEGRRREDARGRRMEVDGHGDARSLSTTPGPWLQGRRSAMAEAHRGGGARRGGGFVGSRHSMGRTRALWRRPSSLTAMRDRRRRDSSPAGAARRARSSLDSEKHGELQTAVWASSRRRDGRVPGRSGRGSAVSAGEGGERGEDTPAREAHGEESTGGGEQRSRAPDLG